MLHLLGGVRLQTADGPARGVLQRHRLALLALLAAHRGGLSRDKLVALLWPDAEETHARNLLSQAASAVRMALGTESLQAEGAILRLDSARLAVDLWTFEDALTQSDWGAAARAYGGAFLDGFFLRGAAEFERWADVERGRLAGAYARALEALALERERTGDLAGAVVAWRALAAHEPLSSRAALGLIRALVATGDLASALRQGDVHRTLLKEEAGIEPAPELAAFLASLRAQAAARGPGSDLVHAPSELIRCVGDTRQDTVAAPTALLATSPGSLQAGQEKVSDSTGGSPDRPSDPTLDRPPDGATQDARGVYHGRSRRTGRAALVAGALLAAAAITGGVLVDSRGWPEAGSASADVRASAPTGTLGALGGTSIRIAILPFESRGLAESPGDADFADGLTDAIRSQLAQMPELTVIDGRSAGQYRGTTKSIRQIGRELGVPYVLQATVRWARTPGGVRRVQVSPSLVRVADAATVWSTPFTPEPADAFGAQAEVAAQVAQALDVRLGARERARLAQRPTRDPAAYGEYLRGLGLWQRAQQNPLSEGASDAARAFEQAVALDPGFGLAWARLAGLRLGEWEKQGGREGPLARAKAALDSAERLAPDLSETHVARAEFARYAEGNPARAIEELRKARAAQPSDVRVLTSLSSMLIWVPGGFDEAVGSVVRAADLDPRSPGRSVAAAHRLTNAGRYAEAIRFADRAITLAPDQFLGYDVKAQSLIASGADMTAVRGVVDSAVAHLGATAVTRAIVLTWPGMDPIEVLGQPYARRLEALTLADLVLPAALDSANYYVAKAEHWRLPGPAARALVYCDSARRVLEPLARDASREQVARRVAGVVAGYLGLSYACLGQRAEALRWADALADVERHPRARPDAATAAYQLAHVYVRLGQADSAVAELERVVVPPTLMPPGWLRVDPFFAPLHGHPRFRALLARRP